MKILLLNAQAISAAYQQLVNIVNNYDVHIVCLNETRQNEKKKQFNCFGLAST